MYLRGLAEDAVWLLSLMYGTDRPSVSVHLGRASLLPMSSPSQSAW
ncbi:unnamed protein product [Mycena citricolor]|uniref:Uncharacterized protein n=1 Tax=Mycena citricolor TaxID=2018698 RepID=A0AAD2K6P6_9AGAR|nr:unnamed protein product [Mycena citricolor]